MWATAWAPRTSCFTRAMVEDFGPVLAWLDAVSQRGELDPDGFGMLLFKAADEARSPSTRPSCFCSAILSAGADTTYITMANALRAWAEFPDQYARLKAEAKLVRNAFDESLRWDSPPSRMAGRIAMVDVPIDDMIVPAGTRVGLMFAAANRDPRSGRSRRHTRSVAISSTALASAMASMPVSAGRWPIWKRTRSWGAGPRGRAHRTGRRGRAMDDHRRSWPRQAARAALLQGTLSGPAPHPCDQICAP